MTFSVNSDKDLSNDIFFYHEIRHFIFRIFCDESKSNFSYRRSSEANVHG